MPAAHRIAGLQRKVLTKSQDAYVLALETINSRSSTYRVEAFTYLICNAWELLLKARLLRDSTQKKVHLLSICARPAAAHPGASRLSQANVQ
jgi:hypothetical protein